MRLGIDGYKLDLEFFEDRKYIEQQLTNLAEVLTELKDNSDYHFPSQFDAHVEHVIWNLQILRKRVGLKTVRKSTAHYKRGSK